MVPSFDLRREDDGDRWCRETPESTRTCCASHRIALHHIARSISRLPPSLPPSPPPPFNPFPVAQPKPIAEIHARSISAARINARRISNMLCVIALHANYRETHTLKLGNNKIGILRESVSRDWKIEKVSAGSFCDSSRRSAVVVTSLRSRYNIYGKKTVQRRKSDNETVVKSYRLSLLICIQSLHTC